jgi:protein TonB
MWVPSNAIDGARLDCGHSLRREEGAAAAAGRKADPRPVPAPRTPVVVRPAQAPPVAGKGAENAAGATVQGEGTGASGFGSGTGAGAGGDGTGGGGAVTGCIEVSKP